MWISDTILPVHIPSNFSSAKIKPTGILTIKYRIPFRIADKNGFAVPVSIHQPDIPILKINPKLPIQSFFPQFPFIIKNLTLAFQLPSQVFKKNVPYGKIIQALFSTQPLVMVPGFPVPIPGKVFLTASHKFPVAFDPDFLKIFRENPALIPNAVFHRAGFSEIKVCPVSCSLFGRWQWHVFDFFLFLSV